MLYLGVGVQVSTSPLTTIFIADKRKIMEQSINRKSTLKEIREKLKKLQRRKSGFDAREFSGKVHFKDDAVKIQRELRDEWG